MDRLVSFRLFLILAAISWALASENLCAENPATVALVYTVTTPELKEDVVREIKGQVGEETRLLVYEVPEAFEEIKRTGYVTARSAAKVIGTYMRAVEDGADVILSICSTVEDIAYNARDIARYTGIPIIMVNEEMCREAVRRGGVIAIVSTFPMSLSPTRDTLLRIAREMNKRVDIKEVLVEGGFGMEANRLKSLIAERIKASAGQADVILFTQGSMAYCEHHIEKRLRKEVLTNPFFSAKAVKDALLRKGIIE